MKKIAFISSGYLPLPSVNGGAVETLIDLLIENTKINCKYEVDVYSIYNSKAKEKSKINSKVKYIYINTTGILNKIQKISRYIVNHSTNLYIGNEFIYNIIKKYETKLTEYDYVIVENKPEYGIILRKYVKGKLIFHSHNDFLNKYSKNAKRIFDSYDKIFCLSKYICNRVIEIDVKQKNKVQLLYNGIDIEKFNIDIDVVKERKKYGFENDDIIFLYTGRLVKEKGIMELIKAFNLLHNDKYKLLIVGDIKNKKIFKNNFFNKLSSISKNNKNIIYTGYIEYKSIPKIYKIANYGIVPSLWEEPFALTVIEHLSAGHPVIVTNSGGIPELVDSKCSIMVEKNNDIEYNLYNAIKTVVEKKFNKDYLINSGKKFNKERYIFEFINLLEMLDKEEEKDEL